MIDVRARLLESVDEGYREFSMKLIPGCDDILGVRTPVLKSLAKEICKEDWRSILAETKDDYHEERLLKGFVISYAKMDLDERKGYIESFVKTIDNWAICDGFFFRPSKKDREEYFQFARSFLDRPGEYEKRFGIVTLMKFIDPEHIDTIIEDMDSVRHDDYYVKMAVAWNLSMCYVHFPEKTETYLKNCNLDDLTYNKTLQKIVESFRVSDEDKRRIKGMRRRSE